jgi:seryl-tRNA synthetase
MEYRVLGMDNGLEIRSYEDGRTVKVRPDGTKPEPEKTKPAIQGLAERVAELEGEVKALREDLGELEGAFADLLARLPGEPEEARPATEEKKADAEAVNPPKEDKKADTAPAPPKPPKG